MRHPALIAAVLLGLAVPMSAATYSVTSTHDSGPGTLRQAILDANANPGADSIVVTVGWISASDTLPMISDVVAINGDVAGVPAQLSNTAPTDSAIAFWFGAGSSGSSVRRFSIFMFPRAVYIAPGVTNIDVTGIFAPDLSFVIGGSANTIGGTGAGSGNRISQISISSGSNNILRQNTVNILQISGGSNNRVGETGSGNTIGELTVNTSPGLIVEGNSISGGIPDALSINGAVSPALILRNTINATVRIAQTSGVEISQNSIEGAPSIPIDLGNDGATPNDPAPDADTGANNLQNFPVLTSAVFAGGSLDVEGTLTTAPLATFRVELFADDAAGAEARTYLGAFEVTTDAAGIANFSRSLATNLPQPGEVITATATNTASKDTSEVSAPVAMSTPGTFTFEFAEITVAETDGSITLTLNRLGGSDGTVTVDYATASGTAASPDDFAATSGTLTFGPGVTSQTIVIPLVADDVPEPGESFSVVLSAPTGGAAIETTTVTITLAAHLPSEPVPTLSEWSLFALALGLALVMILRTRAQ